MHNEKKLREIHVDQLVIHAKEVKVVDEKGRQVNPPMSPFRMFEPREGEPKKEVENKKEDGEQRDRPPFSWI